MEELKIGDIRYAIKPRYPWWIVDVVEMRVVEKMEVRNYNEVFSVVHLMSTSNDPYHELSLFPQNALKETFATKEEAEAERKSFLKYCAEDKKEEIRKVLEREGIQDS